MTSIATAPAPAFADLLRGWRKIRKLSQWNLALAAGISQRHLSFLECGRSSPSRDMVVLLARALELPLREQNALLNAAGFASLFPHRSLDAADLTEARQALSVMLEHHEPNPAIVVDRNWNLLMSNDANLRLFALFGDPASIWEDIGGATPNIMRATLHPRGFKPFIANWDEFAAYFIQQLNQELTANPYNNEARELLDEATTYPDVPDPQLVAQGNRPFLTLHLKGDDVDLEFFTMVSTFGTPLDVTLQEIRIETFFPATPETRRFIRSLAQDS